jgi:hypothetical protein
LKYKQSARFIKSKGLFRTSSRILFHQSQKYAARVADIYVDVLTDDEIDLPAQILALKKMPL